MVVLLTIMIGCASCVHTANYTAEHHRVAATTCPTLIADYEARLESLPPDCARVSRECARDVIAAGCGTAATYRVVCRPPCWACVRSGWSPCEACCGRHLE